jgi:hypothetical protein
MAINTLDQAADLWRRHVMALEDVNHRLERICRALAEAAVPCALVGGQAVAPWTDSGQWTDASGQWVVAGAEP